MGLQATPKPNTLLFGMGPAAMTELKGVFHWRKANLEWKTGGLPVTVRQQWESEFQQQPYGKPEGYRLQCDRYTDEA